MLLIGTGTYPQEEVESEFNILASGDFTPGPPGEERSPPPPDTHLIIEAVTELVNTTARNFKLRYHFGIRYACDEITHEPPINRGLDTLFDKAIFISLDKVNGQSPDIAAAGPVPHLSVSTRIEKEVKDGMRKPCPVLNPSAQSTQTCALIVTETVANRVAFTMLQEAACPDQTWPNVTGLVGKCRPQKSGDREQGMGSTLLTSA
jgi:hypothetical protein